MTIQKVIDNVRRLKTGCVTTDEQIIDNINRAEMNVIQSVIIGREGDDDILKAYGNYNIQSDRSTELLLNSPYDVLYIYFCCAQIDLEYEDSERYTNNMITYNQLFTEFSNYWAKNHKQKKSYLFHI